MRYGVMPRPIVLAIFMVSAASTFAKAETIRVTIRELAFSPAEVTAKVGDTIEWTNKDPFTHTATAVNGEWDVKLEPGQVRHVLLKKPGAIDYFCKIHPNMKGRVIVGP